MNARRVERALMLVTVLLGTVGLLCGPSIALATVAAQPTGVVMTSAPVVIDTPHRHSAFPGMARHPDGRLSLVWRGDVDHEQNRQGVIMRAESLDNGRTWSTPRVMLSTQNMVVASVLVNGGGSFETFETPMIFATDDLRDPYLSVLQDPDGSWHEYLSFFVASASQPANGVYVSRDGGPVVRVDGFLPYAAVSGPVVRLPNGVLGLAFYGRQPGENVNTAWMAWSSNRGQIWSTNRIMNAIGAGIHISEPWLVVDGQNIHMFARWGGSQIAVRSSADSGVTWPAPVRTAVSGCTGRPSTVLTQAGTLIMVCRDARGQGPRAQVAFSLDHGASWAWGPTLKTAETGTGIGYAYAAPVEVLPGVVLVPFGMEYASGAANLWRTYLAESMPGKRAPWVVPRR